MSLRRRSKNTAAGLRLGFPRSSESLSFDRSVSAEFDNHEIGSRDKEFATEFLLARKGREIHGLLLGSTAYEDLNYVETLLGLEFLELQNANYTY